MSMNHVWRIKLRNIAIGIFLVFFAQLTLPIFFEWKFGIRFWCIVAAIVFYFSLANLKDSKNSARNAFLLIVSFGTVITLIRPVQYALDEESHLYNAIGISDSFLFKYSDEELKDYDAVFLHDGIRNPTNYKGNDYWLTVEHEASSVAGKPNSFDNPAFLPGTLGWNLGRLISDKVYISYYLGRFFHVLAYALLVFCAIKLSRAYKNVVYLMGTLPSALYVVSGYHYDYLYYGASLLLIAMLTNVLSGKEKIGKAYVLKFQTLAFLFAFAKFPFILLGSLLLPLPEKYFKSKNIRLFSLLTFLPVLLLSFIYTGIINLFDFSGSVTGESPGLFYFIVHPLPIVRTMLNAPVVVVDNFIRRPLQYVSHESGLLMVATSFIIGLSFFFLSLQIRIKLPKWFKYYTILLLLGITFLMVYAITGDPRVYAPGDIAVGGVQGRYYYFMIALVPLFLGNCLHRYLHIPSLSQEDEERLALMMQYALSFLTILTVSVGFYTQI